MSKSTAEQLLTGQVADKLVVSQVVDRSTR